jgi:hypothetical protein
VLTGSRPLVGSGEEILMLETPLEAKSFPDLDSDHSADVFPQELLQLNSGFWYAPTRSNATCANVGETTGNRPTDSARALALTVLQFRLRIPRKS